MVEKITISASPPGIRPTNTLAISIIRRAMPPCDIRVPARTNSGIASNGNESSPAKNFCGRTTRNSGELYSKPAIADMPSEIPTGTDNRSVTTRVTTMARPISYTPGPEGVGEFEFDFSVSRSA